MSAVPKQELALRPESAVATTESGTLMQIIAKAAGDGNYDVAKLEKLLDVKERWEANEARKAFVSAMAAFKSDPPSILKSKEVNIPGGAKFSHATLAAVCDGVIASLSKYGFSHRWEVQQQDRLITVTCVITHTLGHQERTTLSGAPDDSGKKNAIQQVASTVTYLERYSLMAATGLAAKDMDNDGDGGGVAGMDEGVVADHLSNIDAAGDIASLLAAFGPAWKLAEAAKDKGAQRLFMQHKDARKKALGAKS